MSTAKKTPATIRQGGPGAAHENAKAARNVEKPAADHAARQHSQVSGDGGESDSHHSHDPDTKGGQNKGRKRQRG